MTTIVEVKKCRLNVFVNKYKVFTINGFRQMNELRVQLLSIDKIDQNKSKIRKLFYRYNIKEIAYDMGNYSLEKEQLCERGIKPSKNFEDKNNKNVDISLKENKKKESLMKVHNETKNKDKARKSEENKELKRGIEYLEEEKDESKKVNITIEENKDIEKEINYCFKVKEGKLNLNLL